MLAEKKIDEHFYNEWRLRHQNAAVSINEREDKLMAVYEEIECDMELVGVTAIEDKLQDGVQRAISNLQMAGIKIWVLTGDKEGKRPSKLLQNSSQLRIFNFLCRNCR